MVYTVSKLREELQRIEAEGHGNVGVYWYAWDPYPRMQNWGVCHCHLRPNDCRPGKFGVRLGIDNVWHNAQAHTRAGAQNSAETTDSLPKNEL